MRRRSVHPQAAAAAKPDGLSRVDSLQRGLQVLRCFHQGENDVSLGELAARLGLSRATTLRLLETLGAHGFVLRVPGTDRFGLHVACLVVGQAVLSGSGLVRAARPMLQEFSRRSGAHSALFVHEGEDLVVIASAQAQGGGPAWLGAGIRAPVAATAVGRAWIWSQGPQVQGEWVARLRSGAVDAPSRAAPAALYRAFQELEECGACRSGSDSAGATVFAAPARLPDGGVAVLGAVRALPPGGPPTDGEAPLLQAIAELARDLPGVVALARS